MQEEFHTSTEPRFAPTPFHKNAYPACKSLNRPRSAPTPFHNIAYPACKTRSTPQLTSLYPYPLSRKRLPRLCTLLRLQDEPLSDLEKAFAEARKRSQAQDGPAKVAAAAVKAAPKPKVAKAPEAADAASKVCYDGIVSVLCAGGDARLSCRIVHRRAKY